MNKKTILKKSGAPSPFFYDADDSADPARHTVYKQTEEGVKRMRGVTYDAATNQVNKD
ncbi:MAG TPA: hypothetical protein VF035_07535 [Longimicrobiales bacterium]